MSSSPSAASAQYIASLSTYFNRTEPHTAFQLFTQTQRLFPSSQHVFVEDCAFPLRKFLAAHGLASSAYEAAAAGFTALKWARPAGRAGPTVLAEALVDGALALEWEGTRFDVFHAAWTYADFRSSKGRAFHFVFDAPDDAPGKRLVKAVYDWAAVPREEIWVYQHGGWSKEEELYRAVQTAGWDDVVLEPGFVDALKSDTETFFASEEIYTELNISWKRGILLLGPPGNGKTQTIQALLKDALARDVPCLYVKTFKTDMPGGEEWGIRMIFDKAREEAPCILVLEDLDAMVKDSIRSYFLNELDGLAKNHGILTIATSNHPEQIDDAILRRPSRFDQKYTFGLPSPALREQYALKWLRKIQARAPGRFDFPAEGDEALARVARAVAARTGDWSFAFLKELFVSFLLRSASDRSASGKGRGVDGNGNGNPSGNGHALGGKDEEVLMRQIDLLAEQVSREGKKIGDGTKDKKEEHDD